MKSLGEAADQKLNPPDDRYVIRAVARALDVLLAVATAPADLDLSSLSRAVHLHPATVFRMVQTLKARCFVAENGDGTYRIDVRAFEVGSSFLRGASLWRSASDIAEHLAELTGETANIGIRDSDDVLYIAIARGQQEIGVLSVAGGRHPLYCAALGKVLLAHMAWVEARTVLASSRPQALTKNTITSMSRWQDELVQVRRHGYALDDEERIVGVKCVAAPIRDHTGQVIAAISASAPAFRLVGKHFEETLRHTCRVAEDTSTRLGYASGSGRGILALEAKKAQAEDDREKSLERRAGGNDTKGRDKAFETSA
jgi:DNA-binding IclR family transcriptional regulator